MRSAAALAFDPRASVAPGRSAALTWQPLPRWLACAAVAWGAFAFGAVYPWAYWPLAVVCAVAGLTGLFSRGVLAVSSGTGAVAATLAVVATAGLVQVIPIPGALLAAASPHTVELLNELDPGFAWRLTGVHAISLDPAGTMRALVLFVSLGLLTLGLARNLSRGGAHRFVWVTAWLGVALAVTGIVQQALHSDAIYGVWTPLMSGSPFGPFVNRNHFAGWMVMAIPLTLGHVCATFSGAMTRVRPTVRDWILWLSSPEATQAVQAGFAAILMGVALILTLSRSGMLSLAVALIVCGYAAVRRQRGALGRSVIVGCLAVTALTVVLWAGIDTIISRFAAADTIALGGRIAIWQVTLRILEDFWLTGSGLNTFGVATLFYPTVVPDHHLQQAHNDYLQLAAEGGILVAAPALAALTAFVLAVRHRFTNAEGRGYWIRLGAVCGLIAIGLQSLVEFSLQLPGNAVLCAALCAVALHRSPSRPPIPIR